MQRPPRVAGRFYPDDGTLLREEVARLMGPVSNADRAIAVIAPHGGFAYSGAIAGAAYAQIRVPSVAVLLGPNHTGYGTRGAIMTHGQWEIPGRVIEIDGPVAEEFRGVALLTEDARAHSDEHALEVQLPFLAARNPQVRIVPVSLGPMPYAGCVRIGHALADVVIRHGREVLIAVSTDLSHYHPAEVGRAEDERLIEPIRQLDAERLYRTVLEDGVAMCGVIPTTIALLAAKALGAQSAELVRHGHSGEASEDLRRVVGYASFVIR